jgi:hypothetical protein
VSKEKAKGDAFERACAAVFRMNGHPHAERVLRLGARDDRGDITGLSCAIPLHVDCKDRATFALAAWLDECREEAERVHACPVVIAKRRGKSAERAYVVMDLTDFALLVTDYVEVE